MEIEEELAGEVGESAEGVAEGRGWAAEVAEQVWWEEGARPSAACGQRFSLILVAVIAGIQLSEGGDTIA